MDEEDIGYVDMSLNLEAVHPSQISHVSAVLSRVSAGLALEGVSVCLHTDPSAEVTLPMSQFFMPEDEERGDG